MTKNMGKIDRIIRAVLAVVIALLFFAGQISGIAAVVLAILAVVFIATSAIGFCPLYVPFKINTIKK